MQNRKNEWLDAVLNYLLKHGVANMSLRPMAVALGTSPRVLMFHFKSKEGLLQDVLTELNARLQSSFADIAFARNPRGIALLKSFWLWASSRENLPRLRLLYEVQIIALQNSAAFGRYLKKASLDWQTIALKSLSKSVRSGPMATICIAVFDGLLLEMMSTGDRQRLTRALDHFIGMASSVAAERSIR